MAYIFLFESNSGSDTNWRDSTEDWHVEECDDRSELEINCERDQLFYQIPAWQWNWKGLNLYECNISPKEARNTPRLRNLPLKNISTYWRSGPIEPDSARDDPLVRGEGRQEEISFCLSSAHSQCNTLEKVVDAESQDYEESSWSGLNETVTVFLLESFIHKAYFL